MSPISVERGESGKLEESGGERVKEGRKRRGRNWRPESLRRIVFLGKEKKKEEKGFLPAALGSFLPSFSPSSTP